MFMPCNHSVVSFGFRQFHVVLRPAKGKRIYCLKSLVISPYVKGHESRLDLKRQRDAVQSKTKFKRKNTQRAKLVGG